MFTRKGQDSYPARRPHEKTRGAQGHSEGTRAQTEKRRGPVRRIRPRKREDQNANSPERQTSSRVERKVKNHSRSVGLPS